MQFENALEESREVLYFAECQSFVCFFLFGMILNVACLQDLLIFFVVVKISIPP